MSDPLTLTVAQAAAHLGISRNSAYEAIRRGTIPSIGIGRRILIPRQKLLDSLGGTPSAASPASPVAESRRAQGLPEHVEDPAAIAQVVALFRAVERPTVELRLTAKVDTAAARALALALFGPPAS